MRPAKTLISLGIRPVWSEPSLCAQWVAKGSVLLQADSEDWSDWADDQADLSLRWAHMPFCFIFFSLCREESSAFIAFLGSALSVALVLLFVPKYSKRAKAEGKAATRENQSSRVSDQVRLKPVYSAKETSLSLAVVALASICIILSMQRTTKVLIRLCGCAGWSGPLLFPYDVNRFCHDVAHMSQGWQNLQNGICTKKKTLCICADDQPSLCFLWVAKDPKPFHVYSEDWSNCMCVQVFTNRLIRVL